MKTFTTDYIKFVLVFTLTLTLVSFSNFPLTLPSLPIDEICDNGIDDDNDGLIDLNDPDCDCLVLGLSSLIPNPSFEEKNCCPSEHSQLYCATGWIQASYPTTDFIHTCDWMGWSGLLSWENFPVPLPLPDGEGAAGFRDGRIPLAPNPAQPNWKEYAGACLNEPMKADSTYRIEFDIGFVDKEISPDINVTFFGTTDCSNLPFGINSPILLGCPTNEPNWENLGSSLISSDGQNIWVKSFIDITPDEDIAAIAIGPPCQYSSSKVSTYYYLDNLLLAETKYFDARITEKSHPCKDNFALEVKFFPSNDYQWYKNGIALIGENNSKLSHMYGEGRYQVRILNGIACILSEIYEFNIPIINTNDYKTICKNEIYEFGSQTLTEPGTYLETFTSINNCDSIVTLHLNMSGIKADSIYAKIFQGDKYQIGDNTIIKEGNYLITLISSIGCDSLVFLNLEYYNVYFPNVFTPNHDGYNDTFTIFVEDEQILNIELTIFDRWGMIIYNGSEWDGRHQNIPVISGVYVYIAKIQMDNGSEHQIYGDVTVLR